MTEKQADGVELYESSDGSISLQVQTDRETVWVSRQQMAELFGRDVKTIGKHTSNARLEELDGTAVVAKYATTAADGKIYQVEHYDLDVVISVGYRVKSAEGIHFRRWANDALKRYVLAGAAINEQRLEQLGSIVQLLSRSADQLVAGVADVLAGYLPGLTLLRDYDAGQLDAPPGTVPGWQLTIDEARSVIGQVNATKEGRPALSRCEGSPAVRRQQAQRCGTLRHLSGSQWHFDGCPRLPSNLEQRARGSHPADRH